MALVQKAYAFLFTNQTDGQTMLKNVGWLSFGKLGGRLLRTAIVIYAARVLGAADWGTFSYAVNLIALFAVITDFGISPVLTRETARDPDAVPPQILSTALYVKIALLAPAVLFLCFFAYRLPALSGIAPLLGLFALMLVFDTFRQLGFSMIKARGRMEVQAALYLLTNVIIVAAGFLFLSYRSSVSSLAYAYAIGSAVGVLATWVYLRPNVVRLLSAFDWSVAKDLVRSAWPFAITAALGSIMISTDIFVIGFLRPVADVGLYSVADRIMQVLYAPSLIVATSAFPILSRLAREDDRKLRLLVKRIVGYLFLFGIPATMAGIALAPFAIQLLFGSAYSAATLPLQILLVTLVLRYASVVGTYALFTYDRRNSLLWLTLIGIGVNAALDIGLIPGMGLVGASLATLVAQSVNAAYIWREFRKATRQGDPYGSGQPS